MTTSFIGRLVLMLNEQALQDDGLTLTMPAKSVILLVSLVGVVLSCCDHGGEVSNDDGEERK